MDADTEENSARSIQLPEEILRAILKEVQALRQSNRRLERHVTLLSAQVEELSSKRKPETVSIASQRDRGRPRLTSHRDRSTSSRRSTSRVSFTGQRAQPPPKQPGESGAHKTANARSWRSRRNVLHVGGTSNNKFDKKQNDGPRTCPAPPTGSEPLQLLPVARFKLRHREVFIARLDKSITAARMHAHLKSNGITAYWVKKVEPRYAAHSSSFIVNVTNIDYAKLFEQRLWADGTLVMDFKSRDVAPKITEVFPSQV